MMQRITVRPGIAAKTEPMKTPRLILARKGTDAKKVAELKELYDKILADKSVTEWLSDTMLLEVDTMTNDQVLEHIQNVQDIVNEYKDLVVQ